MRKTTKKSTNKVKDSQAEPATAPDAAAKRFKSDLETRGESAKLAKDGKLPLDATHVVTQENEDGTVKEVKRARFKMM